MNTTTDNNSKGKLFKLLLSIILVVTFSFVLMTLGGCDNSWETVTSRVMLKSSDGSFMAAEIVVPKDGEESMPLVTLGHGYKGTMNSGGAKELAVKLAANAIATIRPDYNHYVHDPTSDEAAGLSKEERRARVDEYTLSDMEEDQLTCIRYMLKNYSIDESRIALYARSMGGRVAMTMANKSASGFGYAAMALVAPAGNENAMQYYMHGQESWDKMKAEALKKGRIEHQGLYLTHQWFTEFEDYNPAADGWRFNRPVLVIYNTLDHVVTAKTSKECAAGYENATTIEVTTEDGHGYEMGFETSEMKDMLMESITEFFVENLFA